MVISISLLFGHRSFQFLQKTYTFLISFFCGVPGTDPSLINSIRQKIVVIADPFPETFKCLLRKLILYADSC
jgi:hypothetical protein